jgi:hypothetical protein
LLRCHFYDIYKILSLCCKAPGLFYVGLMSCQLQFFSSWRVCFVDGYLIRKWWVSYNYNYFVNCSLSLSPVHSLFVLSYSLLSVAEREHCLIFFHFFSPLHIAAMMFAFGICFRKMRFFLLSSCDSLIPKKKKNQMFKLMGFFCWFLQVKGCRGKCLYHCWMHGEKEKSDSLRYRRGNLWQKRGLSLNRI